MQMMDVNKLVPHEKNDYFFDDIPKDSEQWMAFTESIETSGIIEPLVVSETTHVIISGHQRLRAAKQLKMKQVPVSLREFKSEDEVIKELIEANIRQRGIGNTNPVKLMRCERELERIYGVSRGNNQHTERIETEFPSKTQSQLAEELGISPQHWRNIKNIEKLAPEVQDMVERGQVTESAVRGLYKVLSPEQQRAFAEDFADKGKVTGKEVEFYKNRVKTQQEEIEKLRNQKPEVIEKEVEVVPDDYEQVKKDLERAKADNSRIEKERQAYLDSLNKAKDRLAEYENPSSEKKAQMHLEEDAESFIIGTYNYIKRNGGFVWVTEKMDNLPEEKANEFKQAVMAIDAFAKQMIENIGGYQIG